jgi:SAM-dependent methyltransferase
MTASSRPAPFSAFTTPQFWDDPHISAQMLALHLDPEGVPASRPHAFIDRSVAWLIPTLHLAPGSRLLDLGCGPGLYAHRLARKGIEVLGVDTSRRSIDYARRTAEADGLSARFRRGNYLTADLGLGHDAAILIYEDYCALSPAQRASFLPRIGAALRAGGRLLFDVTSSERFAQFTDSVATVPDLMDGFWAEPPYTGTHETWTYPDLSLVLERYTIETATSSRQFWNWMHCLTPAEVTTELTEGGFTLLDLYGDVTGEEYSPTRDSFAVVAQVPPTGFEPVQPP